MAMAAAIDRLDREVVVVAAAGNHASMRASGEVAEGTPPVGVKPAWPAALDDVIAVGASAPAEGQLADFSPDAPWVDLCTEGVDIVSTFLPNAVITQKSQNELKAFGGSFARWNGTSFSAALVSGAIAACVEPGRTTARQALDQLMREVNDEGELRLGRSKIPFLPLLNRH
jgi:subtilisin family serine protease